MSRADGPAISRVGFSAWSSNVPEPYCDNPAAMSALRKNFDDFARKPTSRVTVALKDDSVVGWGARDNRLDPGNLGCDINHISDLWVDPDFQGQGIGTALLKAMIADIAAWHYETATIEMAQSNLMAKRLYAKLGFEEFDRSAHFSKMLGRKVPVVVLEKYLG